MKKILFITLILAITISCNKSDSLLEEPLDKQNATVQINKDLENDILAMMNYVKSNVATTRSVDSDEPIDGKGYRVYMVALCSGTGGNCLPDVIVTPSIPPTSNLNLQNFSVESFNNTNVGKLLKDNVDNGNLNLKVDENKTTRTTFLVYSNPLNNSKQFVLPLVQK